MSATHGKLPVAESVAGLNGSYLPASSVPKGAGNWSGEASTALLYVQNNTLANLEFYPDGEDDPFDDGVPALVSIPTGTVGFVRVGALPFRKNNIPRIYFDGDGTAGEVWIAWHSILNEAGT